MTMRRLTFSLPLLLAVSGCIRELPAGTAAPEPAPVTVNFVKTYAPPGTRSSVFPATVESVESGGVVAFYDAETGILDSQFSISDPDAPLSVKLPQKRMNAYMLGNLWLVDWAGRTVEITFPANEADARSMVYLLGGKDAGGGLRTETYQELSVYGIPVCGSLEGVSVESGSVLNVNVERLFAKVEVTVDHSGMSSEDGDFCNEKLYIRQANGRILPFADGGGAAQESSDILSVSDYELPMEDGALKTYCFYVPENGLGVLLPGNKDAASKDYDALKAAAGDVADLATYVEFSATVDKAAGGFGGPVCYRFYLGADNVSDFSVVRNTPYSVRLSFNVDSLFEPDWKLSVGDGFSDSRVFCLTKDAAFRSALGSSDVAVRPGRPGKVYVYMNRTGAMGSNDLLGRPMVSSYSASSLSDCAWGGDFSALQQYGIAADYAPSTGLLTLSVSDPSRFSAGREIPLRLKLYPGERTFDFNVATLENQEVLLNTSEFYLGMKRSAVLKGFAGSCATVRTTAAEAVFRTSADQSSSYLDTSPSQLSGTSVDLYAYGVSDSAGLEFCSEDTFNDDPVQLSFKVYKPSFNTESKTLKLFLDGTGVSVDCFYRNRKGVRMEESEFDTDLYSQLLVPQVSFLTETADKYAGFSDSEFYIDHLGSYDSADWIGRLINDGSTYNAHPDFLGSAIVRPASSLYSEFSTYSLRVYFPYMKSGFPSEVTTNYYNEYAGGDLSFEAEYYTYGNNNILISGGSGTNYGSFDIRLDKLDEDLSQIVLYASSDLSFSQVPYGPVSVQYGFYNKRAKNGTMGVMWTTSMKISHNVTLGQFGIFRSGSPAFQVYLTYPKAAWNIKEYYAGNGSMPIWNAVSGVSAYNNYLKWSRMQTIAAGTQQSRSGGGNSEVIYYCDLYPGTYPVQQNFTAATTQAAFSDNWLTGIHFESGGATLSQPLASAWSGNSWFNIRTSSTKIGYIYLE